MTGDSKLGLKPNSPAFVVVAGLAAFSTYFCMYAFRKPVSAARFEGVESLPGVLDYKIAVILCHAIGYALAKWIGVRVVSEREEGSRGAMILALIGGSWLALLGFAIVPAPWNLIMIFFSAVPLGMIWGFVFSYLEGRRTTEILSAILCCSFIFSSGAVKAVGAWLMYSHGVAEQWMPFLTGALFVLPLLLSVWVLSHIPAPSEDDITARTKRVAMNKKQRRRFSNIFWIELSLLIAAYVMLTVFRDIRDNFAAEIWNQLGFGEVSALFVVTELPITLAVLFSLALLVLVKQNGRAYSMVSGLIISGFAAIAVSTFAHMNGLIGPITWMIVSGGGLYLAYVPFGTILFDRMLAVTGFLGNAGFVIYLADAFGYTASIGVLMLRYLVAPTLDWLSFFNGLAYATSALGVVLTLTAYGLFRKHLIQPNTAASAVSTL